MKPFKLDPARVSAGLRRNIQANQNIKRPEYHKPKPGHTKALKKV